MLITPFFPALRARLAARAHQQSQALRQVHFPLLVEQLRTLLPVHLLSSEDEGSNSRERIFSLRLTFECFVWQLLKPATSCREAGDCHWASQCEALCHPCHEGKIF